MRLRITFSKSGPLTYTSHLDLARAWERSLRRAGIPLAYSGGFNPRPKLQLAAALPLGHTGEAELLDAWLEKPMPVQDFAIALAPVLPDGLTISQVCQVELKEPALQTRVVAAEYRVTVERCLEPCPEPAACTEPSQSEGLVEGWDESAEQVEARIEQVLAATELPHERRGRRYDLRPLIERLWLERCPEPVACTEPSRSEGLVEGQAVEGKVVLGMQLAARAGATARPEVVLESLGMSGAFAHYHRRRLIWKEMAAAAG